MADTIDKLPGCTRDNCVCLRNQDELTKQLLDDPDPHVRIIAHMSSRQLAMVESLNNVNGTLQTVVAGLNGLKSKVETGLRELGERVDDLAEAQGVIQTNTSEFEGELPTGSNPLA